MSTSRYVIPDLDDDDDDDNDQQRDKESRSYFSKRTKIDNSTSNTKEIDEQPKQQIDIPSQSAPVDPPPAVTTPVVAVAPISTSASLLVHSRQRGNPLLKHFRQVKWEYSDSIPGGADYQMSRSSCALYLSLRYHALNPNYIYERLKTSRFPHQLKILLVQCDVSEASQSLKELARLCLIYELTLLLSWNDEESAKYLETYKIMEGKSAENLLDTQQHQSNDFLTKYTDTITQVKSINKSDGQTLLHAFGSVESILNASNDQLSVCPGLGKLKAQRLFQAFHQPFLRQKPKKTDKNSSSSSSTSNKTLSQKEKRTIDPEEDFLDLSNIDEDM